jgi:Flp pilus assembly protein TadD
MDRVDEAQQAAQPGLAMSGRHPILLSELATMQSLHGDAAGAEAIHRELVERAKTGYIGAASLAVTAAAAGHMADARTFLAQAIAARDSFISFHKLPAFRSLWADPECAAMLRNSEMMQGQPR